MTDPILIQVLELQNEQTAALARIEERVASLPSLQSKVETLELESRDQKTAIRTLKLVGSLALGVFSFVVAYVSAFGSNR